MLIAAIVDVPRLAPNASDSERQAHLDKRKHAVERLIDSNATRGSRDDAVVSLGANLNGNISWHGEDFYAQPLGICLGAALDVPLGSGVALHVDASPLDILGFATFRQGSLDDSPIWSDVLAPTLHLGLAFAHRESHVLWNVGAFIGNRPGGGDIGDTDERVDIWGFYLGAYVPLLDLN